MQILSKRAKEEAAARRMKHKGRRVSFAPDDELETMHLYALVSLPPSDRGQQRDGRWLVLPALYLPVVQSLRTQTHLTVCWLPWSTG